jgi:hypothetical protein
MTRWIPYAVAACVLAAPGAARADYFSWSASLSSATSTGDLFLGSIQLSRPPGPLPAGQGVLTTGTGAGAAAIDPSYAYTLHGIDPRTGQPGQAVYRAVLAASANGAGGAPTTAAAAAGGPPFYFARYVFDVSLRDVFYVGPILGIHEEYVYYFPPDTGTGGGGGTTAGGGGPPSGGTAPEPASLLLAALGLPFAAAFRRR